MCPPMIVWPNAICFHFVRKNINKQYITENVFLTMSLVFIMKKCQGAWSQVIYLNYMSWTWENCKTRRTFRTIVTKVHIDQKVQDEIIVLSLTGINDSRIIINPKDHSIACWKQCSQRALIFSSQTHRHKSDQRCLVEAILCTFAAQWCICCSLWGLLAIINEIAGNFLWRENRHKWLVEEIASREQEKLSGCR